MFVVDLREYRSKVTSTFLLMGDFGFRWSRSSVMTSLITLETTVVDGAGGLLIITPDHIIASPLLFMFICIIDARTTWGLGVPTLRIVENLPEVYSQLSVSVVLNLSTNRRLCRTVVHICWKKCTSKFSPGQFKLCCWTVSCILFIYQLFLFFPQLFLLKTNIRSTYRSNNLLFYYNLEY